MPIGSLFSFLGKAPSGAIDNDLVRTLTGIRVMDYNIVKINAITDDEYALIKQLIETLGMRILKANLANHDSFDDFIQAKLKLTTTISNFMQGKLSKFAVISFAAQLLQYYTIICDDKVTQNKSLSDFNNFLTTNKARFGDTSKNLLVAEYQLIKLYNDIAGLTDSVSDTSESEQQIERDITYLSEQIVYLNTLVKNWVTDAPDNVFVHYLDFVVNYSFSKMSELKYQLLKNHPHLSHDSDESSLSDTQQMSLKLAKNSLVKIEKLFEYFKDRKSTHSKGLEFSLGQNVLTKLPITNLEEVKTHVASLTSSC